MWNSNHQLLHAYFIAQDGKPLTWRWNLACQATPLRSPGDAMFTHPAPDVIYDVSCVQPVRAKLQKTTTKAGLLILPFLEQGTTQTSNQLAGGGDTPYSRRVLIFGTVPQSSFLAPTWETWKALCDLPCSSLSYLWGHGVKEKCREDWKAVSHTSPFHIPCWGFGSCLGKPTCPLCHVIMMSCDWQVGCPTPCQSWPIEWCAKRFSISGIDISFYPGLSDPQVQSLMRPSFHQQSHWYRMQAATGEFQLHRVPSWSLAVPYNSMSRFPVKDTWFDCFLLGGKSQLTDHYQRYNISTLGFYTPG